jgi:hypothetical protein
VGLPAVPAGPSPLAAEGSLQGWGEIPALGIDDLVAHEPVVPPAVKGHHKPTSRLGAAQLRIAPHLFKDLQGPWGEELPTAGTFPGGQQPEIAAKEQGPLAAEECFQVGARGDGQPEIGEQQPKQQIPTPGARRTRLLEAEEGDPCPGANQPMKEEGPAGFQP